MRPFHHFLALVVVTTATAQIVLGCNDAAPLRYCSGVKQRGRCRQPANRFVCRKTCQHCTTHLGTTTPPVQVVMETKFTETKPTVETAAEATTPTTLQRTKSTPPPTPGPTTKDNCRDSAPRLYCVAEKLNLRCLQAQNLFVCRKTCNYCKTELQTTDIPKTTTLPITKLSKVPTTTQKPKPTMTTTMKTITSVTMVTQPTTSTATCQDSTKPTCEMWLNMGYCKDPSIGDAVRKACPRSCGVCQVTTTNDTCPNHLACQRRECLPEDLVCDGVLDCSNMADEDSCVALKQPKCVLPVTALKNGERTTTRNKNGDLIVKYQCKPGHMMVGPAVRTCVLATGAWDSDSEPQCSIPLNGFLKPLNFY